MARTTGLGAGFAAARGAGLTGSLAVAAGAGVGSAGAAGFAVAGWASTGAGAVGVAAAGAAVVGVDCFAAGGGALWFEAQAPKRATAATQAAKRSGAIVCSDIACPFQYVSNS